MSGKSEATMAVYRAFHDELRRQLSGMSGDADIAGLIGAATSLVVLLAMKISPEPHILLDFLIRQINLELSQRPDVRLAAMPPAGQA